MNREQTIQALRETGSVDVVILGGGVNGACLYDTLCRQGYRVLLADKGDFAGGTSQASGMMVWGGLLYLRNLDIGTVLRLSADRDRILKNRPGWLAPQTMRYLPAVRDGRPKTWVKFGLWLYWLLGGARRAAPTSSAHFDEETLLRPGVVDGALNYEEAFLNDSDARFVQRWIAPHRAPGQHRLNYCDITGSHVPAYGGWSLTVRDQLRGHTLPLRSALVINCAGVWTDQVNASFGIATPFRHAYSKGVYLILRREAAHRSSLFFELGQHGDVITHVPWGPVAMWGPTETAVQNIADGYTVTRADVDFLMDEYTRRYRTPLERSDIIAVRCGIRPLVVERDYSGSDYPLDLSRRQEVVRDAHLPWISCYGGKLTGCARMAALVLKQVRRTIGAAAAMPTAAGTHKASEAPDAPHPGDGAEASEAAAAADYTHFPGLREPVVSPSWSVQHELCATLDDYLRRRTNIAQWVPRGGLGHNDVNAAHLLSIARHITGGDEAAAQAMFNAYREKIQRELAPLLAIETPVAATSDG